MNKIIAATAVAVGLSAGQAHAICTLADIGGTWEFYGNVFAENSYAYAARCTLHIDKKDGTVAKGSDCEFSPLDSNGTYYGLMHFGQFSLIGPDNCTFNLRFQADDGQGDISVEAIHATLSPSKEIMAGTTVGKLTRNDRAGFFTMVKIR